jgi:signal transduction histidine kinase
MLGVTTSVAVPVDAPVRTRGRAGGAFRRSGMLLLAAGLAWWALAAILRSGRFSDGSRYDLLFHLLLVAAVVTNLGAGIALDWLRPANRSGGVLFGLGVAFALWAVSLASVGPAARYGEAAVVAFRPLLFWVVLAWPIGRLARAQRSWLVPYAVALGLGWSSWILFAPSGPDPARAFDNRWAIADLPLLTEALAAFATNVVMPFGAVVVIVSVLRRFRRLPQQARRAARTALLAGLVAALGDLILLFVDRYFGDLTANADGATLLGGMLSVVDVGRFTAVPLLLAWAATSSWRTARPSRLRRLEIGPSTARVEETIARALGDDTARVAYHRDGGGWVDGAGAPVDLGGSGRRVTLVERAGVPVAAVEHDEVFDDRPTTVEVAVAAAGSAIEHGRVAAVARSRQREAHQARHAIVEAEDAARVRLERDLHDGAQQRLVGLALQASLAERAGSPDLGLLVAGVAEARQELHGLASGALPSMLAERGLGVAITTLAATTPLAVDVRLSLPASLPTGIAATAWFVVAEAIANVIKHADASTVRIDGSVSGGRLLISVADDGVGGAALDGGSGLRGLRDRAAASGGSIVVDSAQGEGTTVRLDLPVRS